MLLYVSHYTVMRVMRVLRHAAALLPAALPLFRLLHAHIAAATYFVR